ncbi:MAG: dipeptidase [Gemmatimonadota bacterium]
MLGLTAVLAAGCASRSAAGPGPGASGDPRSRALALMREVPLIDGHNDLPWELREKVGGDFDALDIAEAQPSLHTDIARLREGLVGAQFFAAYVPSDRMETNESARFALMQMDIIRRLADRYPETFAFATTAADIERAHEVGKIAALIGIEGGHAIENSLDVLRQFYRLGARYMTLTHWRTHAWADAATDAPQHQGLSPFGENVIREMNRLGMLVDLSHVSDSTMMDVMTISESPVIYSHSSARAISDHMRNVPDAILRRLGENDGIVMVNFAPAFISQEVNDYDEAMDSLEARLRVSFASDTAGARAAYRDSVAAHPPPRATLVQVANHVDHLVRFAGVDHVGLGSDFDGIGSVPVGLESVATFPDLIAELIRRGYSDDDIRKILGLNMLRVMRAAEATAQRLQQAQGPIIGTLPAR